MNLIQVGPIPTTIKSAELREPIDIGGGSFCAWLWTPIVDGGCVFIGNINSPAFIQFDRELGAMVRGDLAAEKSSEAFYEGQPPFGDAILRVRRDDDGEVYFAWTGMAEQPATTNSLGKDPVTFTHLLAYNSTGAPGNLDGFADATHALTLLRIDSGNLTPVEIADIEMELFGVTL